MTVIDDFRNGSILRIFLDENDRIDGQPMHLVLVTFLKNHGLSGVTVFRGVEGFGEHRTIHTANALAWLPNLPILLEVVDEWEHLEPILSEIKSMVTEGLITLAPVRFLRIP